MTETRDVAPKRVEPKVEPRVEVKEEPKIEPKVETPKISEREELLALYDTLKAKGIHSISDLENLIARSE